MNDLNWGKDNLNNEEPEIQQNWKDLSKNVKKTTSDIIEAKNSCDFLGHEAWKLILSKQQLDLLSDEKALSATGKLLKLKHSGEVMYKTTRGRNALGPYKRIQANLVDTWYLTNEDVKLIPEWVWWRFDQKLVQAMRDTRRK